MVSVPKISVIKQNLALKKQLYKQNIKMGWQEGKRIATENHYGKARTIYTETKKSIVKTATLKELPGVLTVAGACTPIPGGFVVGYILGKAIQLIAKGVKKIK